MKILKKATLIAALALFAGSAFAQQKFGHVSREEVVSLMPEVKAASEKLEAFGKELQTQLEEMQVEVNKKYDAYDKAQKTLSEEMKNAKIKEIQEMGVRLEEQKSAAEKDFAKKREELFAPILKKASDAISKVAKAGGYTLVFDPAMMYYMDETKITDLLPAVKTELGIK